MTKSVACLYWILKMCFAILIEYVYAVLRKASEIWFS